MATFTHDVFDFNFDVERLKIGFDGEGLMIEKIFSSAINKFTDNNPNLKSLSFCRKIKHPLIKIITTVCYNHQPPNFLECGSFGTFEYPDPNAGNFETAAVYQVNGVFCWVVEFEGICAICENHDVTNFQRAVKNCINGKMYDISLNTLFQRVYLVSTKYKGEDMRRIRKWNDRFIKMTNKLANKDSETKHIPIQDISIKDTPIQDPVNKDIPIKDPVVKDISIQQKKNNRSYVNCLQIMRRNDHKLFPNLTSAQ
jgi:hypothetical protein